MNVAHRDHVAFARVCSGAFHRGRVDTHLRRRLFATKYAQQQVGRHRETADFSYPGDVIGPVNVSQLGIGDTLYAENAVTVVAIIDSQWVA